MIYVSKQQLSQVEYLIQQSKLGNHVLFDPKIVRRIFARKSQLGTFSEKEAYEVEHHIERVMEIPTFLQKRTYLEALPEETYERVVRTYFHIVENNMYETSEVRH